MHPNPIKLYSAVLVSVALIVTMTAALRAQTASFIAGFLLTALVGIALLGDNNGAEHLQTRERLRRRQEVQGRWKHDGLECHAKIKHWNKRTIIKHDSGKA